MKFHNYELQALKKILEDYADSNELFEVAKLNEYTNDSEKLAEDILDYNLELNDFNDIGKSDIAWHFSDLIEKELNDTTDKKE